jgi:hypothetical protein
MNEQMEMSPLGSKNKDSKDINRLIELYQEGKLTKTIANAWLDTLPKEERDNLRIALEDGTNHYIEDLPD